MTDAIHYIGAGLKLEYDHMHTPITRGELPADEVVLIHPSEQNPIRNHFREQLTEALGDINEVSITSRELGRDEIYDCDYTEIYHFAYSELIDNLRDGNEVYINVSSGPVFLGYAFIYATFNLVLELTQQSPNGETGDEYDGGQIRNRIHFYETEGHSYLGDIHNVLKEFSTVLGTLETNIERQEELLQSIETEGERVGDILQTSTRLMEEAGDNQPRWQEFSTHLDELHGGQSDISTKYVDNITSLDKGLQQLFEGLSKLNKGLDTLSDENLRTEIINTPDLANLPHHHEVMSLLKQTSGIPIDNQGSAGENGLIQLLGHKLESLKEVTDELDYRRQDIERMVEKNEYRADFHNEIWEYGMSSGGIRIGEDQRHLKYPIPPAAGLRGLESAVIVTLYSMEQADSITELIDELIRMAVLVADEAANQREGGALPTDNAEIQNKLKSEQNDMSQSREELVAMLRSKVQYNLNQLEEKGFIHKEKKGRTNRIYLTQIGELWIHANEFNRILDEFHAGHWQEELAQMYDGLAKDIVEKI